ncbi:MAG: DUF4956 domain-containing protein [Pseudomonadales bacterium]
MANSESPQRPLLREAGLVALYYGITLGGLMLLMFTYPQSVDYLPIGGLDEFAGNSQTLPDVERVTRDVALPVVELPGRAIALLTSLIGTLVFVMPIAWVYGRTRAGKRAGAMIETLFLLPIVVATVVVIVQNSIALAFSLFGIVAAVQFRNSLKNPADAVFVFAALAVGLASGVSEVGVAGVGSMIFCITVLGLRTLNVVSSTSS